MSFNWERFIKSQGASNPLAKKALDKMLAAETRRQEEEIKAIEKDVKRRSCLKRIKWIILNCEDTPAAQYAAFSRIDIDKLSPQQVDNLIQKFKQLQHEIRK